MRAKAFMIALALAISSAASPAAADDPPTITVCLKARAALAPRSAYTVRIEWNGYRWATGDRVDIGIWDSTGEVWPQLRDNRYRPGRDVTYEDIVVGDSSIWPLQFGLIRLSENLARLSDLECQRGFCSIPGETEGLEDLTRDRAPIVTAGGGRPCERS
jgi:hypothetical protein